MSTKEQYIAALIAFTQQWYVDAWQQDADTHGKGFCSGCRGFRPVVFDSMLQWCENCYPVAASYSQDTQPHDWPARREGQERDYGWQSQKTRAAVPSRGEDVSGG